MHFVRITAPCQRRKNIRHILQSLLCWKQECLASKLIIYWFWDFDLSLCKFQFQSFASLVIIRFGVVHMISLRICVEWICIYLVLCIYALYATACQYPMSIHYLALVLRLYAYSMLVLRMWYVKMDVERIHLKILESHMFGCCSLIQIVESLFCWFNISTHLSCIACRCRRIDVLPNGKTNHRQICFDSFLYLFLLSNEGKRM